MCTRFKTLCQYSRTLHATDDRQVIGHDSLIVVVRTSFRVRNTGRTLPVVTHTHTHSWKRTWPVRVRIVRAYKTMIVGGPFESCARNLEETYRTQTTAAVLVIVSAKQVPHTFTILIKYTAKTVYVIHGLD